MQSKATSRQRRAKKARMTIRRLTATRLTVHRTSQHIYAQLIDEKNQVIAVASTLEKVLREKVNNGGNIAAAKVVGASIALKAKEKGITKVAFDRSGFKYHGRVKALADAAREAGLDF